MHPDGAIDNPGASCQSYGMVDPIAVADDGDEFAWLENVDSVEALDWVRQRNAETLAELAGTPSFLQLQADIRQVYDSDDRISYPTWRGDHFYNFWTGRGASARPVAATTPAELPQRTPRLGRC